MSGPTQSSEGSEPSRLAKLIGSERFRYLIVGAANTGVGFGLFVLLELLIGSFTSYFVSLYGSFFLGSIVSFASHRALTFRVVGKRNVVKEFLRFQGVNLGSLALNSAGLPFLVEIAGLTPIVAQGLLVIVTTVVGYLGHKFFSFAVRYRSVAPRTLDTGEQTLP